MGFGADPEPTFLLLAAAMRRKPMRVGVPPGLRLACWPVADPDVQPGVTAYARGTDEFSRVLAFSDAVFAIAMTLLVVGIAVPTFADPARRRARRRAQ